MSLYLAEMVVFFSYGSEDVFCLSTKWRFTCLSGTSTVRLSALTSPTVGSGRISNNLISWNERYDKKNTIHNVITFWHKFKNKPLSFLPLPKPDASPVQQCDGQHNLWLQSQMGLTQMGWVSFCHLWASDQVWTFVALGRLFHHG